MLPYTKTGVAGAMRERPMQLGGTGIWRVKMGFLLVRATAIKVFVTSDTQLFT